MRDSLTSSVVINMSSLGQYEANKPTPSHGSDHPDAFRSILLKSAQRAKLWLTVPDAPTGTARCW